MLDLLTKKLTVQKKIGEVSYRDFYNAHNETVTNDLKQTGYRVARFLTNQEYPSINIGQDLTDYRTITGAFSFKYAAVQAGLGVIGKNGILITPSYGPRVKLSVVITEAPLKGDNIAFEDLCSDCEICVKVCPSGALKEPVGEARPNYDRFVCCSFYTANEGCPFSVKNTQAGIAYISDQVIRSSRKRGIKKKHVFFGGEDANSFAKNFVSSLRSQGFLVANVNSVPPTASSIDCDRSPIPVPAVWAI